MPDDFDALDYARDQLHILAQELDGMEVPTELRLHMGLLAAQVAVAERMPAPRRPTAAEVPAADQPADDDIPAPVTVIETDGSTTVWDVDLIARLLTVSNPSGVDMIQAIADEGGRITMERFLEVTGRKSIGGMTQAIRRATGTATANSILPPPQLVRREHVGNDRSARLLTLYFPDGLLPLVRFALDRTAARSVR